MYAAGVPHRTRGKLLGTAACVSAHMVGEATPAVGANAAFAGVVLLSFVTPFEATRPLLRLPSQSISTLEAAVLLSFGVWALALIASTSRPAWRTRFTAPWLALVAAMTVASLLSSVSRTNALHMTGRIAAAFGVFLLTVAGVTTQARLRIALAAVVVTGAVVSLLAGLEYFQLAPVLRLLTAFRPGLATVGAQVRAGGSLQYPTIASMYLEIVFAFGLGLLLIELDAERRGRTAAVFAALVLIAEAIALTFTRTGLITMAASLALVGASRYNARGRDRGVVAIAALTAVIGALLFASRSTQSLWLRFTSEGQESWYRAAFVAPADISMANGEAASIPVTLINTGRIVSDSDADPLVGVGPDNFRLSYASYAGLAAGDPRIHSNNMYLEVLAGAGIAGALAFAWLLWSIARVTRSAVANPASLAIAAAVLAIAVHGAVDSFLSFAPTYVLFAMTLGFAHVNAQLSGLEQQSTPRRRLTTYDQGRTTNDQRLHVHAYRV